MGESPDLINGNTTNKKIKLTMEKPLSKEELVERLKALEADTTPKERSMGAMCYSPSLPELITAKCDLCHKKFQYSGWGSEIDRMKDIVKEMKDIGYDVRLEIACNDCAENNNEQLVRTDDINYIFYFRTDPSEDYHRAIANDYDSYKCLLAFLKNEREYAGHYDNTYFVDEKKETLTFMTGIKFDE